MKWKNDTKIERKNIIIHFTYILHEKYKNDRLRTVN